MKLLGNIIDQVWLPDTFFVNDLSDKKSSGDYLFELTQEGRITYSYRYSVGIKTFTEGLIRKEPHLHSQYYYESV